MILPDYLTYYTFGLRGVEKFNLTRTHVNETSIKLRHGHVIWLRLIRRRAGWQLRQTIFVFVVFFFVFILKIDDKYV